jgi:hypothetical protein
VSSYGRHDASRAQRGASVIRHGFVSPLRFTNS